MFFKLEALYAHHGDALLLQYGAEDDPRWILIDGGPGGTYNPFIFPRFEELREEWAFVDVPFPLRMVMVSHVDADHIVGVQDLFAEQRDADAASRALPYAIDTLWHNGFDDIAGPSASPAAVDDLVDHVRDNPADNGTVAVIQSVAQGRDLRNLARRLGTSLNEEFGGELVMAPAAGQHVVDLGDGLRFTVVGPDQKRIERFQRKWNEDLVKILKKEADEAAARGGAQAFTDRSPANLASIVVLAELDGRTMLLCGDARGDYVLDGLENAGLLDDEGWMHVDLLKMPHHGSDRNLEVEFFHRITADHYVVSGDGHHGNPEPQTLRMLARARGSAPYTVHVTFTPTAAEPRPGDNKKTKKDKALLARVFRWIEDEKPPNCQIVFRQDDDSLGIAVDLSEPRRPDDPPPRSKAEASPGGSAEKLPD